MAERLRLAGEIEKNLLHHVAGEVRIAFHLTHRRRINEIHMASHQLCERGLVA